MNPPDRLSVDVGLLAAAAARLATAVQPAPTAVPPWTWGGAARLDAAAALDRTLALHRRVADVLAEVGDVLARAAVALGRAAELDAGAMRVLAVGGDPGLVDRLRAAADTERADTDAALAARLHALAGGPAALPAFVVGTDPVSGWVGRPLADVPAGLAGEVSALEPEVVAADATAPVALRIEAAPMVVPSSLLGPGRQFLLGGGGAVAEVWGDVTSATKVVVLVPGTGVSADDFAETRRHGQALAAAMGPGAAVIAWLGSPMPPTLLAAVLQRWAKAAAPRLRQFVRGLDLRPGVRLTVVGHSYGAVVAGLAVRQGLRPAALVGVAPAGFGPTVRSTADLAGTATYVLQDPRDPIRDVHVLETAVGDVAGPVGDRVLGAVGVGHLGDDPVGLPGAVQLPPPRSGRPLLPVGIDGGVHSEYFEPGSEGLGQIVRVAEGGS